MNFDSKCNELVTNYINSLDWRVKENSTVGYSLGGLILGNSGAVISDVWLTKLYPDYIANLHRNCDIHIHDLSMLSGYCAGWSLKQLIQKGISGVDGRVSAAPASHLSTLCNQMVNFLGIMQNEWAGAQAFSSFDTYLAPFVRVDNLNYKEVKQCIQSFVFGVNIPSRWGTQAPFTNITLDWTVPDDMANLPCIVDGKNMSFCYKDCKKEMDMINKAFIEIMIEGDADGRGFQYPIPTYSITKDFDWSETENNKLLFQMTAKYGTPYFSNYINSDMKPSDIRSMCPVHGNTKLLWYSNLRKSLFLSSIKDIYNNNKNNKVSDIKVISNGKLIPAKINKFNIQANYKITLSNGISIITTANHLNKVLNKPYTETKDLKVGDYLPYSLIPYDTKNNNLTYNQGKLIGMFLGDGSFDGNNGVIYSLNNNSKKDLVDFCSKIGPEMFGKEFNINIIDDSNCRVSIYSNILKGLILEFVKGKDALTRYLNINAINQSNNFKKGILDGYLLTDGARNSTKERVYTSSKDMVDSICALVSSMGIPFNIVEHSNDKCIINNIEYNSNGVNYEIDLYKDVKHNKYGDKYIVKDNYLWFSIKRIDILALGPGDASTNSYCVEVLSEDEPIFMLGNGLYTHNCRLRLDLRELRKKSGGFFGSGESTGSIGVVTINMPRIGYLAIDKEDFYKRLDHIMDLSAESLNIKRKVITNLLNKGLFPYTKEYLGTFKNHFSTIGLVGMNEACLNANWLKKDLSHQESIDFSKEVLNHMRTRLSDYQEKYGDLYNLEATPAESTAYRLAKHDVEKYPNIITAGTKEAPYYTNSSNLPVTYTDDVFSALDIQDQLQTLYTSGTVFHTFLGEKLPTWKSARDLVRKICSNYHLPYITISPTYSICEDHGYIAGEHYTCPICGKVTEVWSRITGYYRPVKNWNTGKTQEFKDRKEYNVTRDNIGNLRYEEETSSETPNTIDTISSLEYYLVGTPTCPNCKIIKKLLDDNHIKYKYIDATENTNFVTKYSIIQAPTMIILPQDDPENFVTLTNASNIIGYFKKN